MEPHATAGIELQGSEIRYAVIERLIDHRRLLRLGSFTFGFDVAEVMLDSKGGVENDSVRIINQALERVLAEVDVSQVNLVLHPPQSVSFFCPITGTTSDQENQTWIQRCATLLMEESPAFWQIESANTKEMFAVSVRNTITQTRFQLLMEKFPEASHLLLDSMHCSVLALNEHWADQENAGYRLALGWYPGHIEYTLCLKGNRLFSTYSPRCMPTDLSYFIPFLLKHLGCKPGDIDEMITYGQGVDASLIQMLRALFGIHVSAIDPLPLVVKDVDSLQASLDRHAFLPCIGAALA